MKTKTLFDEFEEFKENTVVKKSLSFIALDIQKYMKENHFKNESRRISMRNLSLIFKIEQRELRSIVDEIQRHGDIMITSTKKGYLGEEKRNLRASDMLVVRSLKSMEKLVEIDPNIINLLYFKLNKIKEDLING